jgi:predicted dehydrogenase
MSGQSTHVGAAGNRHAVEVRIVGSRGMLHLDLRDDVLWRYRGPDDDLRVALEPGAGRYDCVGPIDALIEAGAGRPVANNSPAELGARTVEILEAAYRSATSGTLEAVGARTTDGARPS